jgi:hypothetical protein
MDALSSSTYDKLEEIENYVSTLANPNEEHDFCICCGVKSMRVFYEIFK